MHFATARTLCLAGAVGHVVDVEVDVAPGVVTTNLVGRPDKAITEAVDRCRTAVTNSGLTWPSTRRVTILLSPADLPKRGSHLDLAIAVGVLAASRQLGKAGPVIDLEETLLLGELGLGGRLRNVPGLLPMVMAAARHGFRRVVVPEPQVAQARLVPGIDVFGMRSLAQVVALLTDAEIPEAAAVPADSASTLLAWRGDDRLADVDLADLVGLPDARLALEVAAAGGHHLLLKGPRGSGKTSLAERLPGLLPELSHEEALELTAVHALAGTLPGGASLLTRPPFLAPHHSATRASVLGGGTGQVRPGAISKAHNGVVMLDEFPLFSSDIIEALRQPLESGEVTIARGEETATFPARGIVVLACNPCACGNYTPGAAGDDCRCGAAARREYDRRLGGPVIDRIDITRTVQPEVVASGVGDPVGDVEDTATVRARVTRARQRQAQRHAGRGWRLNAHVPAAVLRTEMALASALTDALERAVQQQGLSRRGAIRVHRMAWTLADLAGRAAPDLSHVETALALRTGAALPSAVVRRAG